MLPFGLWAGLAALPAATAADLPATIARVKPSVVGIGTVMPTRSPPGKFLATGFVVGDGRHAVTNAHAIPKELDEERLEYLAVIVSGPSLSHRRAVVAGVDRAHDVALLEFEGPALAALALGDSGRVREGETYAFTGFPIGTVLGMHPVTHRGIVSSITPIAIPQLSSRRLTREMMGRLSAPYDVFQLDATAYPGNSGSPLYDPETGRVVGVINKVFVKKTKENVLENPSGITYAIPIEFARALMREAGIASRGR